MPSFPNTPFHFLSLPLSFSLSIRSCRSAINSFAARVPCREVRGLENRVLFRRVFAGSKLDSPRIHFEESFNRRCSSDKHVQRLVGAGRKLTLCTLSLTRRLRLCWINSILFALHFFILSQETENW